MAALKVSSWEEHRPIGSLMRDPEPASASRVHSPATDDLKITACIALDVRRTAVVERKYYRPTLRIMAVLRAAVIDQFESLLRTFYPHDTPILGQRTNMRVGDSVIGLADFE